MCLAAAIHDWLRGQFPTTWSRRSISLHCVAELLSLGSRGHVILPCKEFRTCLLTLTGPDGYETGRLPSTTAWKSKGKSPFVTSNRKTDAERRLGSGSGDGRTSPRPYRAGLGTLTAGCEPVSTARRAAWPLAHPARTRWGHTIWKTLATSRVRGTCSRGKRAG